MKIKIIAPETGVQITKHVIVHAGDVVDIPFHQAEHLIRLGQAVIAPLAPFPEISVAEVGLPSSAGQGGLPPTTAEL